MPRGLRMLVSYSFLFLVATNATSQAGAQLETSSQPGAAPLVITFQDAMARARKNLPQFLSANTDLKVAHEHKVQARAALLPSVTYNTQFFYAQGTEPRLAFSWQTISSTNTLAKSDSLSAIVF